MHGKTLALLGGLLFAMIAAGLLSSTTASAEEPITKNLRLTGSATDQPIDEDVFCDECIPDLFVSGTGVLYLRFALNTQLDLIGAADLAVEPPEGPLNQGSVIPVRLTLTAKDDAAKEVKLSIQAKATIQIEQNWPGGDAHGDVLVKFNPTLGFTLLEKDLNALHSGQTATLEQTVTSPALIDPCDGILSTMVGPVEVGLNCEIKLGWQTTLNLTGNGITADRTVQVKDIPPILVGGSTIDFPKGQFTDKFELPCDAPPSSFIDYALTNKSYGVDALATGKGLLVLDISSSPIDVLGGAFDLEFNLFDLFGIDPFNTFEGKVVATGDDKPTVALGQVSKDKEQPVVKDVDIVTAGPLKGKPILFSVEANDNCNEANELHYKWSFDDGGTAFGPVISHTFAEAGLHSGVVRAFDKAGNEGARDFLVSVGLNPDSNIKYEGPIGVGPNDEDPIELSALLRDHDGRPIKGRELQFSIETQAGEVLASESNTTDINGRARVMVRPPEAEEQSVAYLVVVVFKGDDIYDPAEFSKTFTVFDNQPPEVSPLPTGIKVPWGVDVEFSGFATDPDGGTPDSLKYVWDFGDGTPTAINQKVTHAFPTPGDFTVTLTVTDKDGASTEVTTDVTINKRPTTLKNCGETQVEESAHKVPLCGRLLVADLDGGDLDAGVKGKTLSFSLADNKMVSGDTDANGESRPSVNLVLSAGCIPGVISFAGDDLYEPFTYEYVFYTVGGGRPGSPAGQVCELNEASAGFQLLDSDGDGCSNGQETGSAALFGGMRDQDNPYDFFDVPVGAGDASRKDRAVNVLDIGAIVARFGTTGDASGALFLGPIPQGQTYHPAFDRTLLGPQRWNLGPPDGRINVIDIALVINQFGHTCA